MCSCDRAEELLSLRLDGQLNVEEARALEEHLASCGPCQSLARDLDAIHSEMPLLIEELPEGFHQALMSRLESVPMELPAPKTRRTFFPAKWLSIAALLALVLFSTVTLSHVLSLRSGSTASVAASVPAPQADRSILSGEEDKESEAASLPSESLADSNEASLGAGIQSQAVSTPSPMPSSQTAPTDVTDGGTEASPSENSDSPSLMMVQAAPQESEDPSLNQRLFAGNNTVQDDMEGTLSEDVREQLAANCRDWLQTSSLPQKDRVDTSFVEITSPSEEDLAAAVIAPENLSQLDSTDWKITLGDPSTQDCAILFCDSNTLSVLGYLSHS